LQALNEARETELRRIFGATEYENMKLQHDPTYQNLVQFAEAWELGGTEIPAVYQSLHSFQDQASLTRSAAEMREAAGQRVNWREINGAIEQARRQTEADLERLLGSGRLARLKQNGLLNF